MAKLLVVEKDPVDGKDTHTIAGAAVVVPGAPYAGTGDYTYQGEVTGGLSDFVTVNGTPLAVVSSTSALRSDGTTAHLAISGSNFTPPSPPPDITKPLNFVPPTGVGDGRPTADAGSTLLTVNGTKALLHGNAFDTCGIPGGIKKATVAAKAQTFVSSV